MPQHKGTKASGLDELLRRGAHDMERVRIYWAVASALEYVGYLILLFNLPDFSFLTLVSLPILYVIAALALSPPAAYQKRRLARMFNDWRNEVVQLYAPDASLDADGFLFADDFYAAGLKNTGHTKYTGSDLLTVGDIRVSRLDVEREKTTTSSDGSQSTHAITIFSGSMIVLPAPLPMPGRVALINTAPFFNGETSLDPKGLRRIEVACPYLRGMFSMGATEPLVGHRLLTPTLQLALQDFCERLKGRYPSFSFNDDRLYVIVPNFGLKLGQQPKKWTPITVLWLQETVERCQSSIDFLRHTAEQLRPS